MSQSVNVGSRNINFSRDGTAVFAYTPTMYEVLPNYKIVYIGPHTPIGAFTSIPKKYMHFRAFQLKYVQ